jgi:hypothetical protein
VTPLRAILVAVPFVLAACASCGTPPMPKGPPPEYEEPPAPSWFEAGAPGTASPSTAPAAADAAAP